MILPSLILAAHVGQVLQPRMRLNETHSYRVNSVEKNYEGAGATVLTSIVFGMPVQVTAVKIQGGTTTVRVVTGPLVARGRSVGKSRTHTFDMDSAYAWKGYPVSLVGVVYPAGGARKGESWTAKFLGSPPLVAGLNATYKFIKMLTKDGQKVALLSVSVAGDLTCRTRGSGQLFVGASDGIVRSGNLHFDIAYTRPGSGGKSFINSHDGLDYTITP